MSALQARAGWLRFAVLHAGWFKWLVIAMWGVMLLGIFQRWWRPQVNWMFMLFLSVVASVLVGAWARWRREHLIRETLGDRAAMAAAVSPLLAGTIARMACDVIATGARPEAGTIRPLYVRRTDAELARDARTRQ